MSEIFVESDVNQSWSTRNAYLHNFALSAFVISPKLVRKVLRDEGMVVWQQFSPLQLLFLKTLLVSSHMDKQPPIVDPDKDVIKPIPPQLIEVNLFFWENTKGLPSKFAVWRPDGL